eukprot:6179208-Pleurochrysis_carterae.AAC.4
MLDCTRPQVYACIRPHTRAHASCSPARTRSAPYPRPSRGKALHAEGRLPACRAVRAALLARWSSFSTRAARTISRPWGVTSQTGILSGAEP